MAATPDRVDREAASIEKWRSWKRTGPRRQTDTSVQVSCRLVIGVEVPIHVTQRRGG